MNRVLLLLLCVGAVPVACTPHQPASPASPSPARARSFAEPQLHVMGRGTAQQPVRFVQQVGNRKQYDLVARWYESNGLQRQAVATFFSVHVTFYARNGARLSADASKAIVNEMSNTVTLVGNVHARANAGMTLDCDRLRYDRTSEMVHGDGHVVITDARGMRATGDRVDSDITLTRTRMQ